MAKVQVENAILDTEKTWSKVVEVLTEYERQREEVDRDKTRSEEWKREQRASLQARYEGVLVGRREEGLELAGEARQAVDDRYAEAVKARQPGSIEAWTEAFYRARFVEEDASRAQPGEILEAYRVAQTSGDTVGMFLWGRYGLWQLEELAAQVGEDPDEIPQSAILATVALEEFRAEVDDGATAERDENLARLANVEARFHQPLLSDETREFAATFGLRPEHVTIHGLGEE